MPEQIKNKPDSKEFNQYLNSFIKRKERQHRRKVMQEIASSALLMIAG
jgi:hypothetical protein